VMIFHTTSRPSSRRQRYDRNREPASLGSHRK
jgi:hypothetical protein